MTSSISVKDLFKQQTMKEPKLAQLGKVLNTCLTAVFWRKTHGWAYDNWI